jgi:phosphatidylserine synthase
VIHALRFAAPQALTASRIVLGMYAVFLAARQQPGAAAILLLAGLATDALDGACARRLGVATDFGKLFDFFADYLYYVVAPAIVSLFLVRDAGFLEVLLLTAPCVFAALRYSRKAGLSETEYPGIPGSAGLPTIAYVLFVAALALLWRERAISAGVLSALLSWGAPVLAALMTARTRYPKLSVYPWILVPILTGLMAMPFVLTAPLARATLFLIAVYVVFGPLLMREAPECRLRRS